MRMKYHRIYKAHLRGQNLKDQDISSALEALFAPPQRMTASTLAVPQHSSFTFVVIFSPSQSCREKEGLASGIPEINYQLLSQYQHQHR